MPKRSASNYASDSGFVADAPPSKTFKRSKSSAEPTSANAKKASESKAPITASQQMDDNDDPFWELSSGGTRRVTVNTFKGKTMVNIREYYGKDGAKFPGKKGISLPVDQWVALLEAAPGIEKVVVSKGESCGRPDYSRAGTGGSTDGVSDGGGNVKDEGEEDGEDEKKNFEATSDEDDA